MTAFEHDARVRNLHHACARGTRFLDAEQIDLRQHDASRAFDLPPRDIPDIRIGERRLDALRIDRNHDALQAERAIQHADLRNADRVRHAARLDHQQVGPHITRADLDERLHQLAADRTAHAAVLQPDHVVAAFANQRCVDIDRAEIVDEYRGAPAIRVGQQRVDHRGLARAEIAADDGKRNRLHHAGA